MNLVGATTVPVYVDLNCDTGVPGCGDVTAKDCYGDGSGAQSAVVNDPFIPGVPNSVIVAYGSIFQPINSNCLSNNPTSGGVSSSPI